jgi:superfamily II DNA helicase RecQ
MSIQFKLFTLSAFEVTQDESSLNLFLRQHRVLKVHREFVQDQQNAYWSLLVEYLDSAQGLSEGDRKSTSKSRVDYKEVLSPENFAVFAKLRDWRKQQAEEGGVPVYAIFTNQQLAEMVTLRVTSKTVKGTVAIRYFNLSFCIAIHQRLLASFLIRDLI